MPNDQIRDDRRFNFTMVDNEILDMEELGAYEKLLYIVLCKYAGQKSSCFPSRETLAKKVSCSVKTIDNKLKSLIEKNLIEKQIRENEKGGNTSNLYIIKPIKKDMNKNKGGRKRFAPGEKEIRQGGVRDSPELYLNKNNFEEEDAHAKEKIEKPPRIAVKYEQVFDRKLSSDFYSKISNYYENEEVLMLALKICEEKADKPAYLKQILQDWFEQGLSEVKDIVTYIKEREKKVSSNNSETVQYSDKAKKLLDADELMERDDWN